MDKPLAIHTSTIKSTSPGDVAKRAFDIFVSALALILLAPILGLIALGVKRTSSGPVFYRGTRFGKGGVPFKILKFRTMYENPASHNGPRVTAQDDPRITPFGRWLRDTKLNELPQFWNVFIGEMSVVGPRPEDPCLAQTWPAAIAREILSVRPGITSPASVQYHNEEMMLTSKNLLGKYLDELTPDKLRMDQLYVRHRSFAMDLDTILWTALLMLPMIRNHTPPEALLFVGPITRLLKRYLNWFTIDLIITFLSISFVRLFWPTVTSSPGRAQELLVVFAFSVLCSMISALLGVNRISWIKATLSDAFDLVPSWLLGTATALVVNAYVQVYPVALILSASALALAGWVVVRFRTRLIINLLSRTLHHAPTSEMTRERVLVVGSGRTAEHVAWMFANPAYARKFRIVGFVDNDLFTQGMRIYGARVIGSHKDIPRLVRTHDIGAILLADHRIVNGELGDVVAICNSTHARVLVVPDIFGSLSGLSQIINEGFPADEHPTAPLSACLYCMGRLGVNNNHPSHSEKHTEDTNNEHSILER